MGAGIRSSTRHSIAELKMRTPLELEYSGRLTTPVLCEPDTSHFRPISWEKALDLVVNQLKTTSADRSFFYASGRSSNEAGFILQLFARVFVTNNVNNCSYYYTRLPGSVYHKASVQAPRLFSWKISTIQTSFF